MMPGEEEDIEDEEDNDNMEKDASIKMKRKASGKDDSSGSKGKAKEGAVAAFPHHLVFTELIPLKTLGCEMPEYWNYLVGWVGCI